MTIVRRTATAAAAVVVACAASTGVANAEPTGKPTTPAAQLLLAQGEFPAGYRVIEVPRQELNQTVGDIGAAFTTGKVTPEQCRPVLSRGAAREASQLPLVAAVNRSTANVLAEVLSTKPSDAATTAPGCESVRVEFDKPTAEIGAMTLTVTSTPVTLAGVPSGTKAVLAKSTGTVTVDGKTEPIDQQQMFAVTTVRGYTVIVNTSSATAGKAPDRVALAQALTKAVDKIRAAK